MIKLWFIGLSAASRPCPPSSLTRHTGSPTVLVYGKRTALSFMRRTRDETRVESGKTSYSLTWKCQRFVNLFAVRRPSSLPSTRFVGNACWLTTSQNFGFPNGRAIQGGLSSAGNPPPIDVSAHTGFSESDDFSFGIGSFRAVDNPAHSPYFQKIWKNSRSSLAQRD